MIITTIAAMIFISISVDPRATIRKELSSKPSC